MTSTPTKKCSSCKETLPATREFFKLSKECSDSLTGTCRKCWRKYLREWKAANRDRLATRRREQRAEKSRVRLQEAERRRWEAAPFRMRASILRGGMRERSKESGLLFDSAVFTVAYLADWLRRQRACECCGRELQLIPIGGQKSDASPSIDRIDPQGGYVVGNVALLCWRCNNIKRDAQPSELRLIADWMDRVARR